MKLQKQSVFLLTVAVIIVLYVPFAIHINNTDINIDKGSVGTTTITTVTVSMTPSKSITTSKTTDNESTTTRKTTKQS
ncbi:MAG: hypothetical protein K2F81_07460, partial [Ruminococcus sp.]|nr:hypothetical protein [Ruminococcus sp.]